MLSLDKGTLDGSTGYNQVSTQTEHFLFFNTLLHTCISPSSSNLAELACFYEFTWLLVKLLNTLIGGRGKKNSSWPQGMQNIISAKCLKAV